MDRRVKEFEQGRIVYRGPNVAERMRLLSRMGLQLSEDQPESFTKKGTLELIADVMEHIGPLVIEIHATVHGREITKWQEALECDELAPPLQEIATEIMIELSTKKKAPASLSEQQGSSVEQLRSGQQESTSKDS